MENATNRSKSTESQSRPLNSQESTSIWDAIAESVEFKDLVARKRAFVIPAFCFFLSYYFALPVLVGYAPRFAATKVIGQMNVAYLFALSQFLMAWIIAALYARAAAGFDRTANDILAKAEKRKEGN